jgi:predicted anti-sigma-YlaC factor YlaD
MPCEHYQTTLTEAAASGILPPELREHLSSCATCRDTWAVEQNLFASIDMGLSTAVNAELPPAFLARVQARVKEEKQPHGKYNWIPTWAFASVSAAILLAFVFPLLKSKPRQPAPNPAIVAQKTSANSTTQQTVPNSIPEVATNHAAPNRSALSEVKHTIAPQNDAPRFAAQPEVIVPPDERQAFARFVATVEQSKGLAATAFPKAQNDGPLQVDVLEIAAVQVEPLSPQTDLTDFFGRTHQAQ